MFYLGCIEVCYRKTTVKHYFQSIFSLTIVSKSISKYILEQRLFVTFICFQEVNWGSSTQAQAYNFALKSALDLNRVAEHVKNYRPQLLVLSGLPSSRPQLIDFAHLITKGNSLLMCGYVMKV